MTQIDHPGANQDRHTRWVAMWREGVRASRPATGLSELATARLIELSARAAELLGTTVEGGIGLNYLDLVDAPGEAEQAFRLAQEGIVDGVRVRRRLRRPDGSTIDALATGWAIRSPAGPDLGLWMASEVSPDGPAAVAEEVVAPSFPRQPPSELDGERVDLDDRWGVTRVGSTFDDLLGRSLLEVTHPDDVPALLFALARATTDLDARALVRLRQQDGSWRVVLAAPVLSEGDGTTAVSLVLATERVPARPGSGSWVSEAPGQLRRIADQIEAAAVLSPLAETTGALGATTWADLSPRQREIVARLIRGQRVATIAAEMYLSRSTVRNHLSAIFAKVGVHSQAELLALHHDRPVTKQPSAT
jgi:DNA-binding CsgD family transcriptional regulator/PAS domain-containing protein